jgi:hypothetical protein
MIDFLGIQKNTTGELTLEELEMRLKPKSSVNHWRDASTGGFLAPDESLIEVLKSDYSTLCSLGKDYLQMAELTSKILKQVNQNAYVSGNFVTQRIRKMLSTPIISLDNKHFDFMRIESLGHQSCPWGCRGTDQFGYTTSGVGRIYVMDKSKDLSSFNRIIGDESDLDALGGLDKIMHSASFTVITDLTPHLIASHYFFQGEASYRTDPQKLLKLILK